MRDGFQGQMPEMPWKKRLWDAALRGDLAAVGNVTEEDNGPGTGNDDTYEEAEEDDDDLEVGWPVSQAAADLMDGAYRFLAWRRGQEARAQ